MKKYPSKHKREVRRYVERRLSEGASREDIVTELHETYHDKAQLSPMVYSCP